MAARNIKDEDLYKFVNEGYNIFLRNISIDCVIFGYHENQLKVLLNRYKKINYCCLPGGHVKQDESTDDAAKRILNDRTGLKKIYLQQFQTFGDPNRLKNSISPEEFSKVFEIEPEVLKWLFDRMISLGYYALVEYSKVKPKPDVFAEECFWCDIHQVPALIFDHNKIIEVALKTLKMQLSHQPIGLNLLPEKFTMPELMRLYETILESNIDRRNFQKKMLSLDILIKHDERRNIGPHRAPSLYSFNKQKYYEALQKGISLAF